VPPTTVRVELQVGDGLEGKEDELNAPRAGLAAAEFRHSRKRQFTFFGEPHAEQTWAWRMVGHHVAMNFTIVDGTYIASTPLLFGSETCPIWHLRPLTHDEDRGFLLLDSLETAQRQEAIIHDVAPPDFVTRVVKNLGDEELSGGQELGLEHYAISDHDREMPKWILNKAKGLPGASMNTRQIVLYRGLRRTPAGGAGAAAPSPWISGRKSGSGTAKKKRLFPSTCVLAARTLSGLTPRFCAKRLMMSSGLRELEASGGGAGTEALSPLDHRLWEALARLHERRNDVLGLKLRCAGFGVHWLNWGRATISSM
jgi:hypothetical protein